MGVSGGFSSFKLDEGEITGTGAKIDFNHSFNDTTSMEVFLASAVNATGGLQASFTGLGGYVFYNIYGNCCQENRSITLDGRPVIAETSERGSSIRVGLGLDQYFLNGSKSVYSASGLGLAVKLSVPTF